MDWEELFQQWVATPKEEQTIRQKLEIQARTVLSNRNLTDVSWLLDSLEGALPEHQQKRMFLVRSLRQAAQIPELMLDPMLKASLYQDSSSNAWYISPCLRCFGPRKINEILLNYFETGTNEEKTGAANGFYCSLRDFHKSSIRFGRISDENIDDLRAKIHYSFLTTFLYNENVRLRRSLISIITLLDFTRLQYPEDAQNLIAQVFHVARSHSDEIIRQRVATEPFTEQRRSKP